MPSDTRPRRRPEGPPDRFVTDACEPELSCGAPRCVPQWKWAGGDAAANADGEPASTARSQNKQQTQQRKTASVTPKIADRCSGTAGGTAKRQVGQGRAYAQGRAGAEPRVANPKDQR